MTDYLRSIYQVFKRFLHSRDALVYMLFVVLASLIWVANAMSTRRTVHINIPIHYINIPDDYILTVTPAQRASVTIEDEGADLFRNRHRDYALVFDLAPLISGESGEFTISLDEIRQAIERQLAGDATLQAFSPEHLSGHYIREQSRVVPIRYEGQIKVASQYQLCGEVELRPREVQLFGSAEALSEVQEVSTILTDLEGVQDTFITRLPLLIPEGVRAIPDSVTICVPTEQFTEKTLSIAIRTPDLSASQQTVHLFPQQVQVTFRVGLAWFNSIDESCFDAFIELPKHPAKHLPVNLRFDNPHIRHIRLKPAEVEYLIENNEEKGDK